MKQIPIPQTPLKFSAMALGTGPFGTGVPLETTHKLYSKYREAGGTVIDTAHCYCFWVPGQGSGSSERAVGECIKKFKDRENVVIVTKGGHPSVPPDYARPDGFLSPQVLASDLKESLERLGIETIDMYLLHRDDPRVPVGEIIETLNTHVKAKQIRAFGASNWTTARIAEANGYAKGRGLAGFTISQPQFSLAHPNGAEPTSDPANRYLYDHDIAWHTNSQLPVMCYSPTAGGYFATHGSKAKESFENPSSRSRLMRASEMGQQRGVSANQIALAWLMALPFPVIPILGTADDRHLADCVAATTIALTKQEVKWLKDGVI